MQRQVEKMAIASNNIAGFSLNRAFEIPIVRRVRFNDGEGQLSGCENCKVLDILKE